MEHLKIKQSWKTAGLCSAQEAWTIALCFLLYCKSEKNTAAGRHDALNCHGLLICLSIFVLLSLSPLPHAFTRCCNSVTASREPFRALRVQVILLLELYHKYASRECWKGTLLAICKSHYCHGTVLYCIWNEGPCNKETQYCRTYYASKTE